MENTHLHKQHIEQESERAQRKIKEIQTNTKTKEKKEKNGIYLKYNVKQEKQHSKLNKVGNDFMKNKSNNQYPCSMKLLNTLQNDVIFGDKDNDDGCNENSANVYGLYSHFLIQKMNEPHETIRQKLLWVKQNDQRWEKIHERAVAKAKEINDSTENDDSLCKSAEILGVIALLCCFCFCFLCAQHVKIKMKCYFSLILVLLPYYVFFCVCFQQKVKVIHLC